MNGNQFSVKLGKVPLYGEKRHSIRASYPKEELRLTEPRLRS